MSTPKAAEVSDCNCGAMGDMNLWHPPECPVRSAWEQTSRGKDHMRKRGISPRDAGPERTKR